MTDVVCLQRDVRAADGEQRGVPPRVLAHDFIYTTDGVPKVEQNITMQFKNADGTIDFTPAGLPGASTVRQRLV